jgi:hypothetical protein
MVYIPLIFEPIVMRKPVSLLVVWAAWLFGSLAFLSGNDDASQSRIVAAETNESLHASSTQDLANSKQRLMKAIERALQGLQGEPRNIFISNQSEWVEVVEAETGVAFQAIGSQLPKIEGFELQHAIKLIKRRSSWIHGLMDHQKQGGDGWTGFWSDNQGGWMSLVDRGGVIYFSASCIRGEDHYLGSVSGKAMKTAGRGIFKSTPLPGEDVLITFTIEGPWLRVEGTNTGVYHGLKAYFDGDYVKIAPLPQAKQKEVISASKEPWPY